MTVGAKGGNPRTPYMDGVDKPTRIFGIGKMSKSFLGPKVGRPRAVRETSDPFHHDTSKHGPRQVHTYYIGDRWVKVAYAAPPTIAEQHAFLKRPTVVCPLSTLDQMKRGDSSVLWLIAKLKKKLGVPWAPDVLSSAITPAMLTEAKETGDWNVVKRVQEYAYVDRRGCHVSHVRGCPNVPRLLEGVKMGVSRFGNPFTSLPPVHSRALFERLIDNDFHPLSDEQVQEVVQRHPLF